MLDTSLIVPTLDPGVPTVEALQERLREQTRKVDEILVVDSSSRDGSPAAWCEGWARVVTIPQSEFNHGATRNRAASLARGRHLVFLTQDALPANERWLEELLAPLEAPDEVAATYSRQLPRTGAHPLERFARAYNYPQTSAVRCRSDAERHGRRALFMSNVSSAVRADAFDRAGGFPNDALVSEEVVLAARLMASGSCIAYAAESQVVHSHDYALRQVLGRYFDIGAMIARSQELRQHAGLEGEGLRYLRAQASYLIEHGAAHQLPRAGLEALVKYAGYRLGRWERFLSTPNKRRLSMHPAYWE